MRAAQLVAPRQWELIETAKPEPVADRMLVKMERVAVCGSDKPPFCGVHKHYPQPPGATGHEGLGVVEACPSGRYREGERVLLWGFDRGLFQEYVLAKDDGNCIRLPDDLPAEKVLMSQLLGTVIHSFYKLGNIINRDAVVVGQGPMGLLMTHMLSNLGARTAVAVDTVDFRLEAAEKMRATHVLNPDRDDVVAGVKEITQGRMADLVVEMVGHNQDTVNLCLGLTKRLGTVLAFGVPDDDVYAFHYRDFFRKNITLIGSVGPDSPNDYPLAMDMIAQRRIDVSPLITHHLPFADVQKGFELFIDHRDEAIKVVLDYGE